MLPTIGIMMAGYTSVRCLSFITRKGDQQESRLVKAAAALVLALNGLGCLSLVTVGASV